MVLTKHNYFKLKNMVRLASRLGCDGLLLQSLMEAIPECKNLKMDNNEITKFMKIVRETKRLVDFYGIFSNLKEFDDKKYIEEASDIFKLLVSSTNIKKDFFSIPCYEPWYRIAITSEGKVGPCITLAEKKGISIGSQSLKSIWFGEYFNTLRNEIFSRNISETCKKCCIGKVFENREIREELKKV